VIYSKRMLQKYESRTVLPLDTFFGVECSLGDLGEDTRRMRFGQFLRFNPTCAPNSMGDERRRSPYKWEDADLRSALNTLKHCNSRRDVFLKFCRLVTMGCVYDSQFCTSSVISHQSSCLLFKTQHFRDWY
jgi:hypothetical protein